MNQILLQKAIDKEIINVRLQVCPQDKYAHFEINCSDKEKENIFTDSLTVEGAIQAGYCVYTYLGKKFCNIESRESQRIEIFLYNERFCFYGDFLPFYKISDEVKKVRPIGNLTSYWYLINDQKSLNDILNGNLLKNIMDTFHNVINYVSFVQT